MGWILYLAVGLIYAGYLKLKNNWDYIDEGGLIFYTILIWPIVFLFRLGKSFAQDNQQAEKEDSAPKA